jgi:hypothetical protein
MRKLLGHPLTPLLLFSVALTALMIAYVIGGAAPSEAFDIFVSWVWSILAALWVVADARRRDTIPCYDFGLFCYLFFPVVVPGYCFWSRGWRGLLMLIVILGTLMVPYIVAGVIAVVLYG